MKLKTMLDKAMPSIPSHLVQKTALALVCSIAFLTGCAVGPDYVRPEVDVPAAYKEDALWKLAKPADEMPKGEWWKVFKDPVLNHLMDQLNRQNLTIIQAEAQYRQAAAYLQQAESGLFPTLDVGASRIRGIHNSNSRAITNQHEVSGTISWEIDIWGEIRRSIEAGEAGAAASLANVAATRLSAQAQLAKAYLELRVTDCQIARLKESEKLLEESLRLTRNQFNAGIISDADVAQAESLWKNAQAATLDAELARTQLEHAIAVSIGQTPATFTLEPTADAPDLPTIPAGIPSLMLQRRPDIAVAERRVAQANAEIGVAKAAFFPSLTLSANGGWRHTSFNDLFTVPNRIWSIGPSIALNIFDAGLRRAKSDEAIAAYDEQVAAYRQQVLTAFQEVEDSLAAQNYLHHEADHQMAAVNAAKRAEQIMMNRYRAGTASYIEVLTAQNTRINAENTWWSIRKRQFTSAASLIAALGGGWEQTQPATATPEGKVPSTNPSPEQAPSKNPPNETVHFIG